MYYAKNKCNIYCPCALLERKKNERGSSLFFDQYHKEHYHRQQHIRIYNVWTKLMHVLASLPSGTALKT